MESSMLTAMLCYPAQGRVFAWIDRMLAAQPSAARPVEWAPPKAAVARSALTNLLQVSGRRPARLPAHARGQGCGCQIYLAFFCSDSK